MPKKYTEELKLTLYEQFQEGVSISVLSKKNKISKSSLFSWFNKYSISAKIDGEYINVREVYLMKKELERIRSWNSIYKITGCTPSSVLDDKLKSMIPLVDSYSIHSLCDALEVRRSTLYHRMFRSPKETLLGKEDEFLKKEIKSIFEFSKGRFGSKKIRAVLINKEITASAKRISRLMKELNLTCKTSRPSRYPMVHGNSKYYKNKLNQEFDQASPNQVWVSDITYIKVEQVNSYICVVIDLFSRMVLSHKISDKTHQKLSYCTPAQYERNQRKG